MKNRLRFDRFLPIHMLTTVNWLKTVTTLAMVALWVTASNHCKLEQIPGFEFLICCDHEETVPHQDDDCETDGCASVEAGLYKAEDTVVTTIVPLSLLALSVLSILELEARPVNPGDFLTTAPPEFPATWQFSYRTALPPRPPSIDS